MGVAHMNEQILIISPNWLGDAVMAMPAVKRFRILNSDARIVILAKSAVASLWRMHDAVDEIIELGKGNAATFAMAKQLRKRNFSAVYILPNSFRSALIPFLARIPKRRGTAFHARSLMINDAVDFKAENSTGEIHQAYEYCKVLCRTAEGNLAETGFHPPKSQALAALELAEGDIPVCIVPGAARGDSKRWPYFAEAAVELAKSHPDIRFIVAGSAGEAELCGHVAQAIGPRAVSLAGKTGLGEFTSLLAHSRLVVCNDSGGMHLASAAGAPVVAIYGITDPVKTGPIGARATVVQAEGVKASRKVPRESEEARAALASVSVDRVVAACRKYFT